MRSIEIGLIEIKNLKKTAARAARIFELIDACTAPNDIGIWDCKEPGVVPRLTGTAAEDGAAGGKRLHADCKDHMGVVPEVVGCQAQKGLLDGEKCWTFGQPPLGDAVIGDSGGCIAEVNRHPIPINIPIGKEAAPWLNA